jgi:hypothetical protein
MAHMGKKVRINDLERQISFDVLPKSIMKDFSLSPPFLNIYQNPYNPNNLSLPPASKSF